MTVLKRFRILPAVLGLAAALAAVSTSLFGDMRRNAGPDTPADPARPDGGRVVEELAATKFSKLPALTYQLRDGEVLFAWQIRPTLEPAGARPRDVVVVVDASASQAGKPLQQARQIVSALGTTLAPADRVSVWAASTPAATRSLTPRGSFFAPDSDEVRAAAAALTEVEYGAGATDLKHALDQALATLAPVRGRQQLVLFLGDGESAFNPVTEADRVALGTRMDGADVFFYAVPLGVKVNPQNLHGLASLTGGAVVRLQEDLVNPVKRKEFTTRLLAALDVPVLKAGTFKFGPEVAEVYPTRLPPLRGDRSTLVMGKLANAAAAVSLTVNGAVVNGRATTLNLSQPLPAPQADHFFLNMMLSQWREAPHKDAPAMLQSDRALALASTQVKLYRDEFLVQASWAIRVDKWDEAGKLYKAAQKIDPNDREAAAGLAMLEKLKAGKVTRDGLQQKISAKADALKVTPDAVARMVIQDTIQDPKVDPKGGAQPPPVDPPPAAGDVLGAAAAQRAVEEQRARVLVDATIRRARQLLRSEPDAAYQDLKRQRDDILSYGGIGPAARAQLAADLDAVMREVFLKGSEIKRQAAAEREAIARTAQRLDEFNRDQEEQKQIQNRISMFRQLMQQARFELAYQEAQLMIQEFVSRGKPVPPQAVASYIIGQHATQLREWRELVRIREDRFLLTMMQTEKSHIPYPDEPPVHFPPAAVWRELTALRRDAYLNSNLGPAPSQSQIDLKNHVENDEVVVEGDLSTIPLLELLQQLSKRHGVTFVINEENFKAENVNDIKEKRATLAATQLRGLKLGTFLDIVLQSMNATYIVRPDYVEITTFNRRLEEKVTRVFPVADLVIPIPDGINQQSLIQNLQVQNAQLAIFGQVLGQATFFGNQGGFGAFGGGQFGGGQPGGGQQFQGVPGQQFGMVGQMQGGMQNQGFGAGALGIGGGQLGQFGNLGGQFGLQGGTQELLLLGLIRDTVARGEWGSVAGLPPPDPNDPTQMLIVPGPQLNSLGYYPPARALIVRGTTRYHPASSVKLKPRDGGMAAAPGANRGGPIVIGPGGVNQGVAPGGNRPGNNPVAGATPVPAAQPKVEPAKPARPEADPVAANMGPGTRPTLKDPKIDAEAFKKRLSADPKRMWSEAIDWTVTDPGLIVASAEFLMDMNEYEHAAEILKGSLRKGLTTDEWAQEALAIALKMSGAGPTDVERAATSAIDLAPADAKAYLKAAQAEADLKNHAQAMRFCKRAAEFAPDDPLAYANTLAYAEHATDVRTDAVMWAANNLLKRDWNAGGVDYHKETRDRLPKLLTKLEAGGQKADDVRKAVAETNQRDLVIELLWQGPADLDLVVAEPPGAVCSATQKRTTGGGVLRSDLLDQQDGGRSETYTAAMAFAGTYTVTVKKALGRPVGDKATIKVTKFKGTPKESHDLVTVDLQSPRPVAVKLDGGSRTDLATLIDDRDDQPRAASTGAAATAGQSGLGGGSGTAGSLMAAQITTSRPLNMPLVNATTETRLPGIGSAADLRASVKFNPDGQTVSLHVNPVFSTTGRDVKLPRVPLIPGGEGR